MYAYVCICMYMYVFVCICIYISCSPPAVDAHPSALKPLNHSHDPLPFYPGDIGELMFKWACLKIFSLHKCSYHIISYHINMINISYLDNICQQCD